MANIIGRITVNGKEILEVDADPSAAAGTAGPKASMAMFDSGVTGFLFIKTGAADTAWQQADVPEGQDWELDGNALTDAGGGEPNEFLGSTNNFDVAFQRNNQELMRLVADGLLVGLNASLGGRLQAGVAALGDEIFKQASPNGGAGARVIHVTRQYKVQTTDAVQGTLGSITIPASSRVQISLKVMANQHGGATGSLGDGSDYVRTISAKRLAAGGAVISGEQNDFTEEDVPQFDLDKAVNVNDVDLLVTGTAGRNLAWSGHVEIMIAAD